jgi:hypothetical protein
MRDNNTILFIVLFREHLDGIFYLVKGYVMLVQNAFQEFECIRPQGVTIFSEDLKTHENGKMLVWL